MITDGESHDSADLQQAIEDSEKDGITRYAIAVSLLDQLLNWITWLIVEVELGFLRGSKFPVEQ